MKEQKHNPQRQLKYIHVLYTHTWWRAPHPRLNVKVVIKILVVYLAHKTKDAGEKNTLKVQFELQICLEAILYYPRIFKYLISNDASIVLT